MFRTCASVVYGPQLPSAATVIGGPQLAGWDRLRDFSAGRLPGVMDETTQAEQADSKYPDGLVWAAVLDGSGGGKGY